jgi:hypothetical protein
MGCVIGDDGGLFFEFCLIRPLSAWFSPVFLRERVEILGLVA